MYVTIVEFFCRYRKIAGDVCQGGDERLYAPYEAECCRTPTEPPTTGIFHNIATVNKLQSSMKNVEYISVVEVFLLDVGASILDQWSNLTAHPYH